jgi:hypothetical protein
LESFPIVCAGTCRGTIQADVVGMLVRPLAKEAGMYELDHDPTQEFPYALIDDGGGVVGRLRTERDAREVVAAWTCCGRPSTASPAWPMGKRRSAAPT